MPAVGDIILPGDILPVIADEQASLVIGPGLKKQPDSTLVAIKPGILREKVSSHEHALWVDTQARRYVPNKGDRIIGVVVQRLADGWKLDVGGADLAFISFLAFEGASKRNRPDINLGDVLFCMVPVAVRDMEPEVACVDGDDSRSCGMGPLPVDGHVFEVPLHVTRKVLSPSCNLLSLLKSRFAFELTCGDNGRIYVKASSLKDTVVLMNSIMLCENMTSDQMVKAVETICAAA